MSRTKVRRIGLEHATIKDNILFGSTLGYDAVRYNTVVDACALRHDLEVFDAGDLTGNFTCFHSILLGVLTADIAQRLVRKASRYLAGSERA